MLFTTEREGKSGGQVQREKKKEEVLFI